MPDIEEFSRLIGQINNIASESETYRKLQASLKTLNEKITPLMKPSQNGIWELLSDQKRNELLEGYTEVGTFIQEYLREVREQGPDHPGAKANANVSDMVSTLAEFIREDTQMLRQYDPAADPKSLPTLFEEARTVTLQPNDRQLSRMGGALSTRIPLTINLNGQKMAGVFTVNQKYDPERIFNRIMDKAISLIPAKKKAEGTALLRGLLNSNNRFKEKGSDVAEDEIDTPKGKILAFMRNILKKERGIYSIPTDELANAIGYLSGQPPQKVLDTLGPKAIRCLCNDLINGELIVNGNARLPEKANIGIRNVAMYRTAQLFGVPEVVCRSVPMKIKVGNQIVEGTFMEKADGIDIHHPTKTTHAVDRRPLTDYDPDGLRKAADLQVLDFICGNIDRHGGNIFLLSEPTISFFPGRANTLCRIGIESA